MKKVTFDHSQKLLTEIILVDGVAPLSGIDRVSTDTIHEEICEKVCNSPDFKKGVDGTLYDLCNEVNERFGSDTEKALNAIGVGAVLAEGSIEIQRLAANTLRAGGGTFSGAVEEIMSVRPENSPEIGWLMPFLALGTMMFVDNLPPDRIRLLLMGSLFTEPTENEEGDEG